MHDLLKGFLILLAIGVVLTSTVAGAATLFALDVLYVTGFTLLVFGLLGYILYSGVSTFWSGVKQVTIEEEQRKTPSGSCSCPKKD